MLRARARRRRIVLPFIRALDCIEVRLILFGCCGSVLHENRALVRSLAAEPTAEEQIRLKIHLFAGSLACHSEDETTLPAGEDYPVSEEIRIANCRYRLCGRPLRSSVAGAENLVLVSLQRLPPEPPTLDSLQARFPLTCQEARVALLLARRKSNEEIALELAISLHTARHHTEQVLRKLGVHSRKEVAAVLLAE